MADEDFVMVQALTTYMEGPEHKNERSAPYRVPRAHATDLTANGFARIVSEEPERDRKASTEDRRVEAPTEAMIENDAKPRGRRGR